MPSLFKTLSTVSQIIYKSNLNDLKEIIDRVGGFSYAQQKISEFNNQAIEALSPYPESPYKKSMIDLISFNTQRKG